MSGTITVLPWLLSTASLAGAILNAKHHRSSFLIWSISNTGWIFLFACRSMWPEMCLFGAYLTTSIDGYCRWHLHSPPAPPIHGINPKLNNYHSADPIVPIPATVHPLLTTGPSQGPKSSVPKAAIGGCTENFGGSRNLEGRGKRALEEACCRESSLTRHTLGVTGGPKWMNLLTRGWCKWKGK